MIELLPIAVPVLFVWMICRVCGKRTKHRVQQDSKHWETYWCEECHIGQKHKTS